MTIAVTYAELSGSPTESLSTGDQAERAATMILLCNWVDRWELMEAILDEADPFVYPHEGTVTGMIARSCSSRPVPGKVSGVAGASQWATYEKAEVTVNFSTRGSDEDAYAESIEPSAEFMTLPRDGFRWGSRTGDKLKEGEEPGRLFRSLDYVLTRYNQTSIPASAMSLVGHVNDAEISSSTLGLTFDIETLLYNPPTINRTIKVDGTGAWTLNYRFSYRPHGWNKYWRSKTQTWEYLYVAGGAEDVIHRSYPLGSFGGI